MSKVLVVSANPNKNGFGASLVQEYQRGLTDAGHTTATWNLFDDHFFSNENNSDDGNRLLIELYKSNLKTYDGLILAFPLWCEMPPYPMVAFMQNIFVDGFAYSYDENGKKKYNLNLNTELIITAGQNKQIHDQHLWDALAYVGLPVQKTLAAINVGPRMLQEEVIEYKTLAYTRGLSFTTG